MKLAERIASTLRENDCAVDVCDLARWRLERPVHEHDGVIAGERFTVASMKLGWVDDVASPLSTGAKRS